MTGLCLGLAGIVWIELPVSEFTLAWRHSVEKVRWEEDYRITKEGLVLEQARIKGNGAGMEIPDAAILRDGSWHYRPQLPPLDIVRLGRTPEAGDYQLCFKRRCQMLSKWLGPPDPERPAVELWRCAPDSAALTPSGN
ncbi:MAG: DUF1850 domain-containing protein [Gammaproteobacteria bacterium]|nr:DUF1850 domain-containing protein [Gammaproteobacteria bacterium]